MKLVADRLPTQLRGFVAEVLISRGMFSRTCLSRVVAPCTGVAAATLALRRVVLSACTSTASETASRTRLHMKHRKAVTVVIARRQCCMLVLLMRQ
jgi:hypothetical protein